MFAVIEVDDGGTPRTCNVFETRRAAVEVGTRQAVDAGIGESEDSVRESLERDGLVNDGGWQVFVVPCSVRKGR